jgi:hypothetical protein
MKNNLTVSISKGNSKMGAIPSVSLPACITCNPDAPCFKLCYAVRIARRYKESREAYQRNLDILNTDPGLYWLQVKAAASMTRFFRYHVSGDIPNLAYFAQMVRLAEELPNTNFLAFTKQYSIVNMFISTERKLPKNLKIIFSNWGSWRCFNPYDLPVWEIIFPDTEVSNSWKICGGHCTECACRGIG